MLQKPEFMLPGGSWQRSETSLCPNCRAHAGRGVVCSQSEIQHPSLAGGRCLRRRTPITEVSLHLLARSARPGSWARNYPQPFASHLNSSCLQSFGTMSLGLFCVRTLITLNLFERSPVLRPQVAGRIWRSNCQRKQARDRFPSIWHKLEVQSMRRPMAKRLILAVGKHSSPRCSAMCWSS